MATEPVPTYVYPPSPKAKAGEPDASAGKRRSRPLTLRQQRFVDALPTANSQADAARIAGYSDSSEAAKVRGSQLVTNGNVQAAIAARTDKARAAQKRIATAQAHFSEHVVAIADTMIARAEGTGRDSQRAGERILENQGVLQRANEQLQQAPIQVVTHTYVLVQPLPGGQGVTVEGKAEELPSP